MRLTPTEFRALFEAARTEEHLYNKTAWRHKASGAIYRIDGLAYDSDREEIVVQYVAYELGEYNEYSAMFSHLKSRFLDSFERVEQVQVWQPVVVE